MSHTQVLPEVVSVVFRRILLRMVAWRENRHLVSVDRIVMEKVPGLLVDLSGTIFVAPQVKQLLVHRPRSEFRYLSQTPEYR